jgi:hypothetical protein
MLGIAIRPQEHHLHLQKMYMKWNNMKELIDKKVHLRTQFFISLSKTKTIKSQGKNKFATRH